MKFTKTKVFLASMLALALGACFMVHKAQAQTPIYGATSVNLGASFTNLFASSATNVGAFLDGRKQANVGLWLSVSGVGASNAVVLFAYQRSLDGTTNTLESTVSTVSVTSAGASANSVITNIPMNGAGYLYLPYVTNSTANIIATNIVAKYGVKISSP